MAKHNKISGQFSARLIEMMESPAYRVLSLSAHRVLSRIEIEWAHHGGQDNGQLPVTFDNFADYGVHRARDRARAGRTRSSRLHRDHREGEDGEGG